MIKHHDPNYLWEERAHLATRFQSMIRVAKCLSFIAVKRHHNHNNSYNGKHLIGAGLQSQRFSPLSSWYEAWQHGRQTWCWRSQEKPKVLHLDLKATEGGLSSAGSQAESGILYWAEFEHRSPQSPLLQWHTSFNEIIPSNSATPYGPNIQSCESMGAKFIQTTTDVYNGPPTT